jgi:hypothetical protein
MTKEEVEKYINEDFVQPALSILSKDQTPIPKSEIVDLMESDNQGFIVKVEKVLSLINIDSEQEELAQLFQIFGEKRGLPRKVTSFMYDAMLMARYSKETTPSFEIMDLQKIFKRYRELSNEKN